MAKKITTCKCCGKSPATLIKAEVLVRERSDMEMTYTTHRLCPECLMISLQILIPRKPEDIPRFLEDLQREAPAT